MRALIFAVLASAASAAADCPPGQMQASCTLHEEGVAALTAGNFDDAATKFRAALAAAPTARSYLGYAQAVEGQGMIALAYETMLVAQRYSNEEMARPGGPQDTAIVGRAERIKYKLAELNAKIAYAWFRLPDGVPARRLVSLARAGEGDLRDPLGRWIVVGPERQLLHATLDDGQRIDVTAQIAAGAQGTVIIPISAPVAARPQIQPVATAPYQPIYMRLDPPPPLPVAKPAGPPTTLVAIDAAFISRNDDNVAFGLGFAAQFERALTKRMALVARGALVYHPSQSAVQVETSANEALVSAGVRTRSKLPLYGGIEAGALIYSRTDETDTSSDEYSHTYPALLVGGGLRLGKMHFELYTLLTVDSGARDLPARFYFTFGFDLFRR